MDEEELKPIPLNGIESSVVPPEESTLTIETPSLKHITTLERRATEDAIDLDYDEDSQDIMTAAEKEDTSDDGELAEDNPDDSKGSLGECEKEDGEKSSDDKEDGELEDGELSDSDDGELPPERPSGRFDMDKGSLSARISRHVHSSSSSGRRHALDNSRSRDNLIRSSSGTSNKRDHAESSWERGMREAREAMRRASKVREEPDFEMKRLAAAPIGERGAARQETDSDGGTPRDSSRSQTPPAATKRIPSLLDLRMSPPRHLRTTAKVSSSRCVVSDKSSHRTITRRSPSYNSSTHSTPRSGRSYGYGHHATELGPQVIYPNGRPTAIRQPERVRRPTRRETPPGPPSQRVSPPRSGHSRDRRRSPPRYMDPPAHQREPIRMHLEPPRTITRNAFGLSPARDASPISSDSDITPSSTKKNVKNRSPIVSRKAKSAMDDVNDPWARKTKPQIVAEKAKERVEKRNRSSRSSSRSADNSRDKKKKHKKRRNSSSSSASSAYSDRKPNVRSPRSPPRGDISTFRIPKKRSQAGRDTNGGRSDRGKQVAKSNVNSRRDDIEEFFAKKVEDTPAAFRSDRKQKHRGRHHSRSSSIEKGRGLSPARNAQEISDSEESNGKSSRSSRSSSSTSSRSVSRSPSRSVTRSPSPALPAKYRVPVEPIDEDIRSISPVSDSEGESRKGRKRARDSRSATPPPPPSPPPPPPPMESPPKKARRRSVTPPPPPPPLPSASSSTERYRDEPSSKRRPHHGEPSMSSADVEKERRRKELMQQLAEVEQELMKKQRAVLPIGDSL